MTSESQRYISIDQKKFERKKKNQIWGKLYIDIPLSRK